jgi:hypothetical protein
MTDSTAPLPTPHSPEAVRAPRALNPGPVSRAVAGQAFTAIERADVGAVRALLAAHGVALLVRHPDLSCPLTRAVETGSLELVELMLAAADWGQAPANGSLYWALRSALGEAAKIERLDLFQRVYLALPDEFWPGGPMPFESGVAHQGGDARCLRWLLERRGELFWGNLNTVRDSLWLASVSFGNTPPEFAAARFLADGLLARLREEKEAPEEIASVFSAWLIREMQTVEPLTGLNTPATARFARALAEASAWVHEALDDNAFAAVMAAGQKIRDAIRHDADRAAIAADMLGRMRAGREAWVLAKLNSHKPNQLSRSVQNRI